MKIEKIDMEDDLFYTSDGNSFPLMDSDISMSELNNIAEHCETVAKDLCKKYYGEIDES